MLSDDAVVRELQPVELQRGAVGVVAGETTRLGGLRPGTAAGGLEDDGPGLVVGIGDDDLVVPEAVVLGPADEAPAVVSLSRIEILKASSPGGDAEAAAAGPDDDPRSRLEQLDGFVADFAAGDLPRVDRPLHGYITLSLRWLILLPPDLTLSRSLASRLILRVEAAAAD
jgi:hypothetical protein